MSKPQIVQPDTLQSPSGNTDVNATDGVGVPTKAATSCEGADEAILKEINKCRYF